MPRNTRTLTAAHVRRYAAHLREQERAEHTIQKYTHDLTALRSFLDGQPLTKAALISWKEHLTATHAPATVNSMLAAANGLLAFLGWRDLAVRPLKIQKALFRDEGKELTRAEYVRLVTAAQRAGNRRLSLVLQPSAPPASGCPN